MEPGRKSSQSCIFDSLVVLKRNIGWNISERRSSVRWWKSSSVLEGQSLIFYEQVIPCSELLHFSESAISALIRQSITLLLVQVITSGTALYGGSVSLPRPPAQLITAPSSKFRNGPRFVCIWIKINAQEEVELKFTTISSVAIFSSYLSGKSNYSTIKILNFKLLEYVE